MACSTQRTNFQGYRRVIREHIQFSQQNKCGDLRLTGGFFCPVLCDRITLKCLVGMFSSALSDSNYALAKE